MRAGRLPASRVSTMEQSPSHPLSYQQAEQLKTCENPSLVTEESSTLASLGIFLRGVAPKSIPMSGGGNIKYHGLTQQKTLLFDEKIRYFGLLCIFAHCCLLDNKKENERPCWKFPPYCAGMICERWLNLQDALQLTNNVFFNTWYLRTDLS